MPFIYYKSDTELGSKRAAMKKERELKKRDWNTRLVSEKVKGKIRWGVEYW